ncbi:uncharacterized protein LOC118418275 [Branchiostoma floridae]|uniref:Uncharacterized protein LOC118418275 n=1 Tax=Branchiostoma floridae TaxID=7739 RepID=A0A9J7MVB8_BRAFL|nr:uncharacterized protein LOC118418275 [Branchiostoma floridae]
MATAPAEVDTEVEGEGGTPPGLNPAVAEFIRLLVPSKEEWGTLREAVSQQWSLARMLDASLYFSTVPNPPHSESDPSTATIPDLLPVAIFVGRLLGNLQRGNIFAMSSLSDKMLFSSGSSFSESEDFRDSRFSESSERGVSESSDESRNSLSLDLKGFHLSDHMTSISESHSSARTSRMSSGEGSARSDDKAFAASLRESLGGELYLDVVLEVVYVWEWCNAATGKSHAGYQGMLHQPHRGSPLLMGLELLYYALLPLLSKVQHDDWEQLLSTAAKRYAFEQHTSSNAVLVYKALNKFVDKDTDALILTVSMDYFGIYTMEEKTRNEHEIRAHDLDMQPTPNPNSSPDKPKESCQEEDYKRNYTLARLFYGLFLRNMRDAVKEGDGERLHRLYSFALLYYRIDKAGDGQPHIDNDCPKGQIMCYLGCGAKFCR